MSALKASSLKQPGRWPVGTVPGLYLWVRGSGTKNWVLRVVVNARRADIGLGGYPAVTLADAMQRARAAREDIAKGLDPLAIKRAAKRKNKTMTFSKATEEYIKLHRASWKTGKHAQQWENTLSTHAYPIIGNMAVSDVETKHVLEIIKPKWVTTNTTMDRVRNRIESILSWAMTSGYRERGPNPATWRGHLDQALPKPSKVHKKTHHAAMPWPDLPEFMRKLADVDGLSARCLEFTILTACRSGEARGATWNEFDLEEKVWNIPAQRMKAGRPHRVPLSDHVVKLLNSLPRIESEALVFPGAKQGRPLSDMSLTMLLRRHAQGVTAHGFRSTFRDWSAEKTNHQTDVCEMALAHAIRNETEAAYRRGDLMEKRRELMRDWAMFARPVK